MTIFTRNEYMAASLIDGPAAFRRYYGQFVCDQHKDILASRIGLDRLLASTDKHLNDIPLHLWDNLPGIVSASKLKAAGDYLTLAGKVCIYKEAARQMIESAKAEAPSHEK